MRKKYRNTLNQPLPVRLCGESLSVPARGYFWVEESDFGSLDVSRLVRKGSLSLVETFMVSTVISDDVGCGSVGDVSGIMESSLEPVVVDNGGDGEGEGEGVLVDKVFSGGEDSLTSNGEMDSNNEGGRRTRKPKSSKGKKKSISGRAPELK